MIYKAYVTKILQEHCNCKNYTISTRLINFFFEAQEVLSKHNFELINFLHKSAEYNLISIDNILHSSGPKEKRARTIFVIHCKLNTDYTNKEIGEIINKSPSTVATWFYNYNLRGHKEYEKFKIWLNESNMDI